MSAQWMRSRRTVRGRGPLPGALTYSPPEPGVGAPTAVNKRFTDRLLVGRRTKLLRGSRSSRYTFVIQYDNGSESVRAFESALSVCRSRAARKSSEISEIPAMGIRVSDGPPNARTCLLHQKLQLLNCCIKRALESKGSAVANSSDDEFFDCSDEENVEDQLPWDRPAGRLCRLENATLKNGAPLYIPRTQDPAPKTEDQLEEDAELMAQQSENAKASELWARMMSAPLLSDMEAFKAANPGAELCDFVQWYSPRDWKPDGGGALSERMLLEGNPWMEAWSVARPVPATRQRRLFDGTREAEQVLHFLRSRTIGAAAELLLPAILKAGAAKAISEKVPGNNASIGGVDKRRTYEIAARELFEAEKEASRSACVRKVLGSSEEGKPLDVAGRTRVLNGMGGALPAPSHREFTLKVKDAVAPQVMRAALSNDMTIIGAFTERIVCL